MRLILEVAQAVAPVFLALDPLPRRRWRSPSYMLAAKYDARRDEVAGPVVVSTLLAVAAIPLLLAFFV